MTPLAPNPLAADLAAHGTRPTTSRRRRAAGWLLAVILVVGLVLAVLLTPRPLDTTPYSTASATPQGARALAQVLREQGVTVTETEDVDHAVTLAEPGTTLVVAPGAYLEDAQVDVIAGSPADLTLLEPSRSLLSAATGGLVTLGYPGTQTTRTSVGCTDADALAAESLRAAGDLTSVDDTAATCFDGAYAVVDASRTVRVIADAGVVTNGTVAQEGNAALALRSIGHHEDVVWLVPSLTPVVEDDGPGIVPPWLIVIGLQGALVVLVAGLWQGRRLGRVVTEALPVVVRSSEATRGRARLYRRHGSRGHAAAGLRAATARRCTTRLGLPRSADRTTVVPALARATGRPAAWVEDVLYGPPPADDAALIELARHLDTMESEVHPL